MRMRHRMKSKRSLSQRSRWVLVLLGTIGGVAVSLGLPQLVPAEGVSGRATLTYAHSQTRSQDLTSPFLPVNESESRAIIQQYRVALDRNLYPNLRFNVDYVFQKTDFVGITNEERSSGISTLSRPFIDLTLRTPLYTVGANYNKTINEIRNGTGHFSTINEGYRGIFGWKPVDMPTVNLTAFRNYNYDGTRTYRDSVTDQLMLVSTYDPMRTVQLRYQGNIQNSEDRINEFKTKVIGNDARVTYGDQFFQDRLSINGYYDYGHRTTETMTSGKGNVAFQLPAVDGLLVSSNIPSSVRLNPAPLLVNTVFLPPADPTSSANNIGSDTSFPLDTTPRNIGLQFAVATELNTLRVWVYSLQGPTLATSAPADLPGTVWPSFRWDLYTSADNQNWALQQTGASATYESDPVVLPGGGAGRFEISFAKVTTRYIKVVVTPLVPNVDPTLNFPGVYVTEVQAFMTVAAADIKGKTAATSQLANVNTKVRIFQTQATSLYYDLTYFSNTSESDFSTTRSSSLSNALSLNHRFSTALSGNTRVMRTDETSMDGKSVTQELNAQILAIPIRTLSHSLGYNVSIHQSPNGLKNTQESLFMSNTAELYQNITAFLNGGASTATSELDLKTDSTNYTWGVNLIPHKTLNMTLSSSTLKSEQSGPNSPPDSSHAKSSLASVSYYPVSLLYLFASWQKFITDETSDTIKNYGLNWSPLPGGSLQLNFSYNETLQARDNTVNTTMTTNARLNINRGAYLNASYTTSTNTSDKQESRSRLYAATLNMIL